MAPAACAGPGYGDETLPERNFGRILLHEASAGVATPLDSRLFDRASLRKRDRFPRCAESCDAAVDREPGVY